MKNSHICPKCGSDYIWFITSRFPEYSRYSRFFCAVYYSFHAGIPISACICCNCGYIENWIEGDDAVKEAYQYLGVNNNEEY